MSGHKFKILPITESEFKKKKMNVLSAEIQYRGPIDMEFIVDL